MSFFEGTLCLTIYYILFYVTVVRENWNITCFEICSNSAEEDAAFPNINF